MKWLFPGFLAGTIVLALPVALHFLRSRKKSVFHFPSLQFLSASAVRDTRRNRLQRWLTLALRVLIIALIAAAFARPFWSSNLAESRNALIIAVDNSMSMQAKGRWEQAQREALKQIAALKPGDHAGLLLVNPSPSWLVPLTDDLASVRTALQQTKPGFEMTRYDAALKVAGETLAAFAAGSKTIFWMADEQKIGWVRNSFSDRLSPGIKIVFNPISPRPERQATILSTRWVPSAVPPCIEAVIQLFEPDKGRRRLAVRVGSKVLAEQDVTLEKGAPANVRIPVKLPEGKMPDWVSVSLDDDDLPSGGKSWLALESENSIPVLFPKKASGPDFLAHALLAIKKMKESSVEAMPPPTGDWPLRSVAIVQGQEYFMGPKGAQLDRFIAKGGALWIFLEGSPQENRWFKDHGLDVTERPAIGSPWHLCDWDPVHPILAPFAEDGWLPLMEIEFQRGFNLQGDKLSSIAKWPDGSTAIGTVNINGHPVFLCGFPLDRAATDWLLRPSFVPFLHQTVRWLTRESHTKTDWHVGDRIPVTSGTWRTVDSPRPEPDKKVDGSVRPTAPGIYEFSNSEAHQIYAVNIPPGESDLTPWPDLKQLEGLAGNAESEKSAASPIPQVLLSDEVAESQQHLWWWLLAICGVGIFAELALANKTTI